MYVQKPFATYNYEIGYSYDECHSSTKGVGQQILKSVAILSDSQISSGS